MASQPFDLEQSLAGIGADPCRQMSWPRRIGWPRHRLLLQWLSVNGTYTRPVRPFLYDAIWRLYNLRHCANSNILCHYTDRPGVLSHLRSMHDFHDCAFWGTRKLKAVSVRRRPVSPIDD
jgi:hypothetical protein